MALVLVTFHTQSGHTGRMARAVAQGVSETDDSRAVLKTAYDTTAEDIRACDALVLCSPEYFGYMAGAIKDLFDRTYEELKDDPRSVKKPFCIIISAGNDGTGALRQIERLCKGYRFRKIQEPILHTGEVAEDVLARCRDLGRTIAEGINARIF